MFGIDGPEFVIILIVALVIMGPEHVVGLLKTFRNLVDGAKRWSARLRAESTTDLSGVLPANLDLPDLDLRQYDPRAIVRQAVHEEMHAWMEQTARTPAAPAARPEPPRPPVFPSARASLPDQPEPAPADRTASVPAEPLPPDFHPRRTP
jgi:sec-independent protein translocase protein TatB